MADERCRVKVYALSAERQWDDRGTGHVSSSYVENIKATSLLVRAESDGSILLESKIQPGTAYQKQQETLIVWSEGDNYDLALSFQEKAGCDDIWEKICRVQGKNPSLDVTLDAVEESDDARFEDVSDSAPPIELPPCELGRLEKVSEMISSCLPSPIRREKLGMILESGSYIKELLEVFHICENLKNLEGLHQLFEIFKNIFLLNKNALLEILLSNDTLFNVVGVLEYDPSSATPKRHRDYLSNISHFKEVIPFSNSELVDKIHQTYRVQYIKDVVLPTPSVFEENMLSTLTSFIFFNRVEIVSMLQEDQKFLTELFAQLADESTDDEKRKDLVMLLKEFCMFSQTLQSQSRESFFKTLLSYGALRVLEITLRMDDPTIKTASIDILSYIVDFSPSMVREYALQQVIRQDDDLLVINIIIEQMICDPDPELGGAVQLSGVIRLLLDPENMLAIVNKSDFLHYFYKHCMHVLIEPVLANTKENRPNKEDSQTAQLLSIILELLSFCVEHHTYHVKNYILHKDLLRKILVLMKSKHTFLALCALRLIRKIIGLKNEFYNRYIIKGNLLAPVVEAFKRNNGRYNLLDSAIVELFEFIKVEDVQTLCGHIVEQFGEFLDKIDYVKTFHSLRLHHKQHLERKRDSLSPVKRPKRYCRDPRRVVDDDEEEEEEEEEEEMWFNDDDDIEDSEPMTEAYDKKMDDEFERMGKMFDKQVQNSEGKENIKTVPNRPFSSVLKNRKNSPGVAQPLSSAVEVKSQLTRKGGLVDYPDEDSDDEDEDDESTNSFLPAKRLRLSS